jgi:periplasmic glucans biosynthesis protein
MLLHGTAFLSMAELLGAARAAPAAPAAGQQSDATHPSDAGHPFDAAMVRDMARQLAQQPYKAPDTTLPDELKNLDYQAYRSIRFDPKQALWLGQKLRFTAEFFSRGFLYKDRIEVFEVANGRATPIPYRRELFTFDKVKPPDGDIGFAGFRLHYPLNRADYYDEVCAFLGASYFRAVAKGQGYGMSARGLAIKTADPTGEEFPLFKTFWLERPAPNSDSIVVHALLDSQSAAAAFRFTIRPGTDTVFDTETTLYPRVDVAAAGLAPLTSMFLFAANDRVGFDDYRNAVHDTSGLALQVGQDEHVWRPLANPRDLQVSAFTDASLRGYGLLQRERGFADYEDAEAGYEKRPSVWVEPIGDWGQGIVELVEIPSRQEVNDNIVAFWRPHDPLRAKGEYNRNYRLHWCWNEPIDVPIAKVVATRCGLSFDGKNRQFVIDFAGEALKQWKPDTPPPLLDSGCSKGRIVNAVAAPLPEIGGWRVSLELDPQDNKLVELHAKLTSNGKPVSELWIYRWTPS